MDMVPLTKDSQKKPGKEIKIVKSKQPRYGLAVIAIFSKFASPNAAPATKSDAPTSPNSAPATKNDSHDWSWSDMKRPVQCAEQQESPANVTKYCPSHEKWLQDWSSNHLIRAVQWAEQQGSPSNVTKDCACHEKNGFRDWSSYETSFTFTLRGATGVTFQRHQRLRLPQNMTFQNIRQFFRERMKRHLQCKTIQTWSENDPSMNWSCRTWPFFGEVTFRALDAFCVEKYNILLLLMLWILQGFFIVRRWWRWALLRGNPDPRPLPKGIIVVCRKINDDEQNEFKNAWTT